MWLAHFGVIVSLLIHVLDQATDVFAGVLFYFEGHTFSSYLTLALVFLPGFCICVTELRQTFCSNNCSFFKAIAYLLFSPLWAIVIHCYSFCDERYVKTALFFKALEGFIEAGPQLALQLSLLLQGGWGDSSKMVIGPIIPEMITNNDTEITTTMLPETTINPFYEEVNNSLVIFDRLYTEEDRFYFGCVHIASVIFSFISILSSTIIFNDVEVLECQTYQEGEPNQCCSKKMAGRLIFGIPFFLSTLTFRVLAITLIICFLQSWSGVIIFGLFFINVLTALFIGDDFHRSCVYALWSMFVPVGYSRDPTSHLGYSKVPINESIEPPTLKDIDRSKERGKHFLTIHVFSSIFILGTSLLVMLVLVFTNPDLMGEKVFFPLDWLTHFFLPILGLSLGASVLLVRCYHRCDWSGGERPSGNIIV